MVWRCRRQSWAPWPLSRAVPSALGRGSPHRLGQRVRPTRRARSAAEVSTMVWRRNRRSASSAPTCRWGHLEGRPGRRGSSTIGGSIQTTSVREARPGTRRPGSGPRCSTRPSRPASAERVAACRSARARSRRLLAHWTVDRWRTRRRRPAPAPGALDRSDRGSRDGRRAQLGERRAAAPPASRKPSRRAAGGQEPPDLRRRGDHLVWSSSAARGATGHPVHQVVGLVDDDDVVLGEDVEELQCVDGEQGADLLRRCWPCPRSPGAVRLASTLRPKGQRWAPRHCGALTYLCC